MGGGEKEGGVEQQGRQNNTRIFDIHKAENENGREGEDPRTWLADVLHMGKNKYLLANEMRLWRQLVNVPWWGKWSKRTGCKLRIP